MIKKKLFNLSKNDITYDYNVSIKSYEDELHIKRYIVPIEKTIDAELDSNLILFNSIKINKPKNLKGKIRYDSLTRTRNNIIDYALSNKSDWHSFVTLTFKENITDLSYANNKFQNYIRQVNRCCKKLGIEFKYLCVPEFQKRGAVHYHFMTNLISGGDLLPLQSGKVNQYDARYWLHGFSSVFDIKNDTDSNFNVALYICKYLYKDIDNRLYGRQKLLKSNNLKKPTIREFNSDEMGDILAYLQSKGYDAYHYVPTENEKEKNSYLKGYIVTKVKKKNVEKDLLKMLKV